MSLTSTPVFVVGPLRSGTSLLYAILNQHPKIGLMYECDVWDFPEVLSSFRFRGDWRTRLEFYNRTFSRHRLVFGENLQGLENVRTPGDLYRAFAESKDAKFFGEKSPFYCTRLCQLAKNYPGCHFILLWRDPVEIHQSIKDAARESRFFRRAGTLNRLIFYQEQMIQEAAKLVQTSSRIHHVTYADLIDRTEESCRGICDFLKIEFDEKMPNLEGADLSAVFRSPQHDYLRNGKIQRRPSLNNDISPRTVQKIQRFRNRWNRLRQEMFHHQTVLTGPEPGPLERLYHQLAGSVAWRMDAAIRMGFEFLPLPWLRTYRQVKAWFLAGRPIARASRLSLGTEFRTNTATIVLSLVILAAVVITDYFTGTYVSLLPFYMIPAGILTLVISQRWGTFAAAISAMAWALVLNVESSSINFTHLNVWLWDLAMRFLTLEVVVLLLGRIRLELNSQKSSSD
jgi:Sulfotransferase family